MKSLGQMVFRRLQYLGLAHEAFAALVLEKTKQAIENNFSKEISSGSFPYKYKNNTIYIRCTHHSIIHYIRSYSPHLLKILKLEFPKEPFCKIICTRL